MGFIRKILSEAIAGNLENSINTALQNHNAVDIDYESQTEHDTAPGRRTIYPTAYGLSRKGNPVIRAYQEQGATASITPAWKLFRLDGIKSWETTDKKFTTRDLPGLKLTPDLQMSIEFKSAFGGEKVDNNIDDTPITKAELNNPEMLKQTSNTPPQQNTTIGQPKNLDNYTQNTDTPSGINPQLTTAPKAEPISKDQFVSQNNQPAGEEPETSNTEALPAEPIMRNDNNNDNVTPDMEQELDDLTDEKAEETEEEENKEPVTQLSEAYDLMKRINNLYARR